MYNTCRQTKPTLCNLDITRGLQYFYHKLEHFSSAYPRNSTYVLVIIIYFRTTAESIGQLYHNSLCMSHKHVISKLTIQGWYCMYALLLLIHLGQSRTRLESRTRVLCNNKHVYYFIVYRSSLQSEMELLSQTHSLV